MKRNILLAFLLVGLVVMEWGCGKCDMDTSDYNVTLYDIWARNVLLGANNRYENLAEKDSVSYKSLSLAFSLVTKIVAMDSDNSSTAVYANDCYPGYRTFLSNIDSLKIYSIAEDESQEITNIIAYCDNYGDSLNLSTVKDLNTLYDGRQNSFAYSPRDIYFYFLEAPKKIGATQFRFEIYFDGKDSLEATTDTIIVTP